MQNITGLCVQHARTIAVSTQARILNLETPAHAFKALVESVSLVNADDDWYAVRRRVNKKDGQLLVHQVMHIAAFEALEPHEREQ